MVKDPRNASPEARILAALACYTLRSGAQLMEMTGLGSHKLYPALAKLERAEVISSEWEDMPPPRRRRYKLAEAPFCAA